MPRVDRYYRGQGRVSFAERNSETGAPQAFLFLGNCNELNLSIDTETAEHQESYTGQGIMDRYVETSQSAMLNINLDNFIKENLALAMFGKATDKNAGSVSSGQAETHQARPGYSVFLDNINLDPNATITVTYDLTGTPTPATEGDDYTVDHKSGRVYIVEGGAIGEEAITVAYSYLDQETVGAFTEFNKEKYFVFEGLNTAEDYSPVVIHAYKVRLQPFDEFNLISDDFSELALEGSILYDTTQAEDGVGGRFFKVIQSVRA